MLNEDKILRIIKGEKQIVEPSANDSYFYQVFCGRYEIELDKGDSIFCLSEDESKALAIRGPTLVQTSKFAVLIRGYMTENKTTELQKSCNLPYINGCSSRQIFSPERQGDPCWQMMFMPPKTKEQMHHVHTTARAVYVLKGKGSCVYDHGKEFEFNAGDTIIIPKLVSHHFITDDLSLTVLPVHIFSSLGSIEFDHPMMRGTKSV